MEAEDEGVEWGDDEEEEEEDDGEEEDYGEGEEEDDDDDEEVEDYGDEDPSTRAASPDGDGNGMPSGRAASSDDDVDGEPLGADVVDPDVETDAAHASRRADHAWAGSHHGPPASGAILPGSAPPAEARAPAAGIGLPEETRIPVAAHDPFIASPSETVEGGEGVDTLSRPTDGTLLPSTLCTEGVHGAAAAPTAASVAANAEVRRFEDGGANSHNAHPADVTLVPSTLLPDDVSLLIAKEPLPEEEGSRLSTPAGSDDVAELDNDAAPVEAGEAAPAPSPKATRGGKPPAGKAVNILRSSAGSRGRSGKRKSTSPAPARADSPSNVTEGTRGGRGASPASPSARSAGARRGMAGSAAAAAAPAAAGALVEAAAVELAAGPSPGRDSPTGEPPISPAAAELAPQEVVQGQDGKVKTKFKGIKLTKTLSFDSVYGAIRAAVAMGDYVWTADWQGNIEVRDRTKVERVMETIPAMNIVWCMCAASPGMVLVGMDGTPCMQILDATSKEQLAVLMGHVGGVGCLVYEGRSEEDGAQEPEDLARVGRFWTGSNDFTIGTWEVRAVPVDKKGRARAPPATGELRFSPAGLHGKVLAVLRTGTLHGHKGAVQCLLRIGPVLWSGGADGTLRFWRAASGESVGMVKDAVERGASILSLALVRGRVWACSTDGCIREWAIGGTQGAATCLRVMRQGAAGSADADKCPKSCLPIGEHVWLAGQRPDISVVDAASFARLAALPAHQKYISSLLLVDRVETRTVWSTSIQDKKLKVWRHELRGDECADAGELQAANLCYAAECAALQQKAAVADAQLQQIQELQETLRQEREERQRQEEQLNALLNGERQRREAMEARLGEERRQRGEADTAIQNEWQRLGRLEAEVEHMLTRMRLLEDELAEERRFRDRLEGQFSEECRLRGEGDAALKAEMDNKRRLQCEADSLLARLARLEEELATEQRFREGLEGKLSEERRLRGEGETALQSEIDGRKRLQGEAQMLLERLARLEAELAEEQRFREGLAGQLSEERRLRGEGESALQSEMDGRRRLQSEADLLLQRLARLEEELATAKAMSDDDRRRLAQATRLRDQAEAEAAALREEMEAKEAERLRALEMCEQMRVRYAQLDVFKLDIIARELKKTDQGLESLRREAKDIGDSLKGRAGGEGDRERAMHQALMMVQHGQDLRAHVRDIIERCLSETQKLHIGAAVVDNMAAGELQSGGVLGGWVDAKKVQPSEEHEAGGVLAAHGNSRAARLRQGDEVRRDTEMRAPSPHHGGRARSPHHPRSPSPR